MAIGDQQRDAANGDCGGTPGACTPSNPSGRLRIVIVTRATVWGGMEVHTANLARALTIRGHAVTIVPIGRGLYEGRVSESELTRVVPVDASPRAWELSVAEWRDLLGPFTGDVCILAKNWWEQGGLRFNLAARSLFDRVFYIEHVGPEFHQPQSGTRRGLRRLLPRLGWWQLRVAVRGRLLTAGVARIICVSDHVAAVLNVEAGLPRSKLTTIRNGVDPHRFIPDPIARAQRRNEWRIPPSAIVCGAVTRLENQTKRLDLLLRAFAIVRHSAPELPLWCALVGDGPDAEELHALAVSLGVEDRLRIVPFHPQPWLAYPALDIFMITSRSESISLALMEAMACECYPIGVRVGGIPEVLGAADDVGKLVSADEATVADALMSAAELSSAERASFGTRARALICEQFDSAVSFTRIAELIEEGSR